MIPRIRKWSKDAPSGRLSCHVGSNDIREKEPRRRDLLRARLLPRRVVLAVFASGCDMAPLGSWACVWVEGMFRGFRSKSNRIISSRSRSLMTRTLNDDEVADTRLRLFS